jgi:signal transduction histidine kinase
MGQLAGSVAHELRNPLGILNNAVYYLKTILADGDQTVQEYLEMISTQIRKSDKIISDLLNFSRTRPDESAEREEVAVSAMIQQVLAEQPPPAQVEVSTQIAPDLPPIFVDLQQMNAVLTNLVSNAYQAMPDGGKLAIKAETKADEVVIAVSDTGVGIPPENINKLFEPLFTTKAKGIGLGLAVSKNLVEANGGTIEVQSEYEKGCIFTVSLPVVRRDQ